ncbi:MAG: SGNH/GDSL hydrolase family protein [Candidatus Competibacteraceae bacterium]
MKPLFIALKGALLFLILSLPTGPSWALSFNQVFIFGDSFSDAGNNAILFDTYENRARTPVPIASPAFIPTAPYESNRYSNGPVWAEQFATRLGLSATASLSGGTDYAYGGARTGPLGTTLPTPPSLLDQVSNQFLQTYHGNAPTDALYVLAGGGNDARDAFKTFVEGGDPTQIISDYVNNMNSLITTLAAANATQIVVWNVPDIGLAPAIAVKGSGASAAATSLARRMNDGLDAVLDTLQTTLAVDIIRFDTFGLIQNLVDNSIAYGLDGSTIPCAFEVRCIANPDGRLFWDGVHLTTAGYSRVADAMLQAIPEPATLLLLILGLSLVLIRRRSTYFQSGVAALPQ